MIVINIHIDLKVLVIDDEFKFRFNNFYKKKNFVCFNELSPRVYEDIESYNAIFLDHDLGPHDTIRPFIDWVCNPNNHSLNPNILIIIHSSNPVGSAWMYKRLSYDSIFTNVQVIPFAWNYINNVP